MADSRTSIASSTEELDVTSLSSASLLEFSWWCLVEEDAVIAGVLTAAFTGKNDV